MSVFDASREWVILLSPDAVFAKKAAEDLSRYIGLLACYNGDRPPNNRDRPPKQPAILDAHASAPSKAVIVLSSENNAPERNGFSWRAETERVEIFGESDRGLCNGIYSFLAALGISWPAPGQESLPSRETGDIKGLSPEGLSLEFPLTITKAHEPSRQKKGDPGVAQLRRFIPDGRKAINSILKNAEAFAAWAARKRYDALVFPLAAFASGTAGHKLKQLEQFAGEYGISLEAGGRDLSSLVPRAYYLFHKDFFRMEEGKRKKEHHFCPTNPGTIRIIKTEGEKFFQAAVEIKVFHLWPDKGAEATWCSCPTCRAFTPSEQNRIAVNASADVLSAVNPGAVITYYEKPEEGGSIPMRKNLLKMERLPDEGKQ